MVARAGLIALSLAVFLPGCPAPGPAGSEALGSAPAWFPARSCRDAWQGLPAAALRYDFRGGYAEYAARLDRQHCYKPWSVLIYMQADNDLAPYAYLDLYEMEAAYAGEAEPAGASTPATDVLVQLDTPGPTGLRRLHVFPGAVPYDPRLGRDDFSRRTEADIHSPVVDLLPENGAPDQAADLQRFLAWGLVRYPAEHYLVVVWGHGAGWAPAHPPAAPPGPVPRLADPRKDPFAGRRFTGGLAFDYGRPSYLDVPALHRVLLDAQRDLGRPIDVYAADACLMQSIEVATELSDAARFVVGSAQVQDFLGLPYHDLFAYMNAGPPPDPAQLARLLPEVYRASLDSGGPGNPTRTRLAGKVRETYTISSLSSAALGTELLPATSALARALSAYRDEDLLHRGNLAFVLQNAPSFLGNQQDLGVFLTGLEQMLKRQADPHRPPSPAARHLLDAIGAARPALERTVVSYAYGTDYQRGASGPADPGFRAFSVWLPPSPGDYRSRIADFGPSLFYRYGAEGSGTGPWPRWLAGVYPEPGP